MVKTEALSLTVTESAYMEALEKASPDPVTRTQLGKLGEHMKAYDRTSNIVDAHMRNIRIKCEKAKCAFTIETVRGVGYRLVKND